MRNYAKLFKNMDLFFWIGSEAVYVWNGREKESHRIAYLKPDTGTVPYMLQFHLIWDRIAEYKEEVSRIIGKRTIKKYHILMAVPEDISLIEKRALEDFVYHVTVPHISSSGLLLCTQSMMLYHPAEDYIAVTR